MLDSKELKQSWIKYLLNQIGKLGKNLEKTWNVALDKNLQQQKCRLYTHKGVFLIGISIHTLMRQ